MEKKVTPYKESQLNKKQQVEQMFDTISSNYDGLNRVISLGSDIKWRKKVIDLVAEKKPQSILDIATGTGDLAIQFAQETKASKIVGLKNHSEYFKKFPENKLATITINYFK